MVRTFSIKILLLLSVFMVEVGCDVTDNIDDLGNKTTKYNPDDEFRVPIGHFGEEWTTENK